MSADCACGRDFPPRDFKTAREADEFMGRVRLSPAFRFVAADEGETMRERYRCRACGRDWACRIPPAPPFSWGPLVPDAPHAAAVEPPVAAFAPVTSPPAPSGDPSRAAFLEPPPRTLGPFLLICPSVADEHAPAVERALFKWRPGLASWRENAGLREIELEIGAAMSKSGSVFEEFSRVWPRDIVNPAWRGIRGARHLRPVHLRGIRERRAEGRGFRGEYYLLVVDVNKEEVVAWMMADVR